MSDLKSNSSNHLSTPISTQALPAKVCNTRHAFRDFTSYADTCPYRDTLNNMMKFNTAEESRAWFTNNALEIMNFEREVAFKNLYDCHPANQVHAAHILAPPPRAATAQATPKKPVKANPELAGSN